MPERGQIRRQSFGQSFGRLLLIQARFELGESHSGRNSKGEIWRTVRNPPLSLPSDKPELTRMIRSGEDYGLRIRDLKFGAATRVGAEDHIVYANHVIAGLRELGPV